MGRVVLVSCASKKLNKRAKAKDLYISTLFKMNLKFAHTFHPSKIFILSAKYGLVDLKQNIDPYNQTLNTMSVYERKNWAAKVKKQMTKKVDFEKDQIIFLAGKRYRENLVPFFKNVTIPLDGLSIGKQLKYLKENIVHE